jgi:hypothetical protein
MVYRPCFLLRDKINMGKRCAYIGGYIGAGTQAP